MKCKKASTSKDVQVGQTFGEWTVSSLIPDDSINVMCKCSCGVERKVNRYSLIYRKSTGCGHNKNREQIIDISGQTFGDLKAIKYAGRGYWECQCICGRTCHKQRQKLINGAQHSCGHRHNNQQLGQTVYSSEKYIDSIRKYIDNLIKILGIENVQVNKFNIPDDNQQFDIYIPDSKLAIEFNGSYWHSEAFKDKQYHQSKSIQCYKQGIHLIHIFEHEWNNKDTREKLINLIKSSLNIDDPEIIQARKLKIQEIDKQEAFEFLNKYHIQNGMYSEINIGAYHNNQLVGVMTFGAQRFDKTCDYEMHRMCWKTGIVCKGGTERLYRYFERKYKPQRVISYCDFQKFTGSQYIRLGFKLDHISEPGYIWWKQPGNIVMTRYQSQKQRLVKLGLGTKEQTEDEIMYNQGFIKIYNSGNLVFIRE